MQEPIDNSQPELQNEQEENDEECSVGEFTVLTGYSNIEKKERYACNSCVTPEGRVEEHPHPPCLLQLQVKGKEMI